MAEESVIEVRSQLGHHLLLEIGRGGVCGTHRCQKAFYLIRFQVEAVELVDRGQIDGERIDTILMTAKDLVAVSVEGREAPDVGPDLFVGSMKDMSAVAVV